MKKMLLSGLAVSYLFASSMQAVSLEALYKRRKRLLPNLSMLAMTSKIVDLSKKDIDDMDGLDEFYSLFENVTIKKLNLSHNQIVEIIDVLSKWSFLEILELDNNKIEDIPGTIGWLSQLKKLDLSNNRLESISPRIQNLTQLEVLDVSNNKNFSDLPPAIVNLTQLKMIAIGNTQLTKDSAIIKAMLIANPKLEVVPRIVRKKKSTPLKSQHIVYGQAH